MERDAATVTPISGMTVALEDADTPDKVFEEAYEHHGLVQFVLDQFGRSERARLIDEQRWLEAYRNYRGVYGPEVKFGTNERSRIFIKVTKSKVLAAYGQLIDVLFSGNRFPVGIEPRRFPDGIAAAMHLDPKAPPEEPKEPEQPDPYGYPEDGRSIGEDGVSLLGPELSEKYGDLPWVEGEGQTPTAITVHPAEMAAKRMEKKIHDQLDESEANKHLRYVAFEAALFGTGVLAGPFLTTKEYPKWNDEGAYEPIRKTIPRLEAVSVWDLYPDPDCISAAEAEYIIRRRKMSRSQLRALKRRPFFRGEAIEAVLNRGPNYAIKWWEDTLHDNKHTNSIERWEVLEFWGWADREMLEDAGLDIPDTLDEQQILEVNAWICDGIVLRLVINPFTPARIPYNIVPFEVNPYSVFGVGVAENMADCQAVMNGYLRMTIDNSALAGNVMLEVDETNLSPGQDFQVYPGKVWRRQSGPPGQAIFATKWPNTTQENLAVFDKARQLADEATGIPSYSHGQTGVSGVGRTAAGISMLMGASSTNIKSTVKNFDDYLLRPVGSALFAFNMQFSFDPEIKGDLEVVARGTESLLRNEVRSQRLMTFLQIAAANPALAPHAKFPYLMRQIALVLDLDPEQVCNNPDEAQMQAMLMQMAGGGAQPEGGGEADMSGMGGGTIGVGGVPTPGENGFSGSPPGAQAIMSPPTPGMPPQ